MNDKVDKEMTWRTFLLGVLSGVITRDGLLTPRRFHHTNEGPALMAVDKDGDVLLISVCVSVVEDEAEAG